MRTVLELDDGRGHEAEERRAHTPRHTLVGARVRRVVPSGYGMRKRRSSTSDRVRSVHVIVGVWYLRARRKRL